MWTTTTRVVVDKNPVENVFVAYCVGFATGLLGYLAII
jgi:hypothetical protein